MPGAVASSELSQAQSEREPSMIGRPRISKTGSPTLHSVECASFTFDVIGLGIAGGMIAMLFGRARKNLRELAKAEPAASRRG